ncbi:ABC transporter ATP-binding protein [Candidatus Halobonum tyrrellensis]|uniref:Oligopeptide/dipeptide ABC transporter ATPase n=1 Tax=Candidatus Halobonum tyrrellensis G22 TaxID=1324957 RepID=V4HCN1_9EURY|nr:ABC transporter ATP-binding protein [Candidatus Halobonum tyrrellensis]ESP87793.1 oligopeptide/dipeptide ABC transporter ATPase [Candidatus Halobonum tyrrellensis G22]
MTETDPGAGSDLRGTDARDGDGADASAPPAGDDDALVEVRGLRKYYYEDDTLIDRLLRREPTSIQAVDGVDLDIERGETLGLVGESGCGKSTTGETLLRLRDATDGSVRFDGEDVLSMGSSELRRFRKRAQIVFQDPFSSLDPRMTVGDVIAEGLKIHDLPAADPDVAVEADVTVDGDADVEVTVDDDVDTAVESEGGVARVPVRVDATGAGATGSADGGTRADGGPTVSFGRYDDVLAAEVTPRDGGYDVHVSVGASKRTLRRERARTLLERVGLSAGQIDRYPHEFSGGQRQRVGIARALALDPEFIVLDEPVSALDVSVQAQILNLLDDLQSEYGLTYLFIAHDLSVVRHICDRVAVMYLGEVVETGTTEELFESPKHPYTEALLESVPRADTSEQGRRVETLSGDVPSPRDPPSGCRFRTRCPEVIPPAGVAVDQSTYRSVMDLRDRLRRGDFGTGVVWEAVGDPDREDTEAFKREVRAEFGLDGLTGANGDTVEDALEVLANGREREAAERLTERFESVCETEEPVLPDEPHPAACHLYDDERAAAGVDDDADPVTDPEFGGAGMAAGMETPDPEAAGGELPDGVSDPEHGVSDGDSSDADDADDHDASEDDRDGSEP